MGRAYYLMMNITRTMAALMLLVLSTPPAFASIESLQERQIWPDEITYTERFPLTRAEFAALVVRSLSLQINEADISGPFADVTVNTPYAGYITEAWRRSIVNTNIAYRPDMAVTRIEAAKMIVMALPTRPSRSLQYQNLEQYTDIPDDDVLQLAAEYMIAQGLLSPLSQTEFGSNLILTQEQAVTLLTHLRNQLTGSVVVIPTTPQYTFPGIENQQAVWNLIQYQYIFRDEVNEEELTEAQVRALVDALDDDYSTYLNDEEHKALLTSLGSGDTGGLGAMIEYDAAQQGFVVQRVLPNSGAQSAGLLVNDLIVGVNSVMIADTPSAIKDVLGAIGTDVQVQIMRNGRMITITVTRGPLLQNPVIATERNGYLVLELLTFSATVDQHVKSALEANPAAAAKGVVIDLRNNGGGYSDGAVKIAEMFLPQGRNIYSIKNLDGVYTYKTQSDGQYVDVPVVVVTNRYTASASEIVAAALGENRRAALVGETTFGKGTGQKLYNLPEGGQVKLSSFLWLTPQLDNVNGVGITPDVAMPLEYLEDIQSGQQYVTNLLQGDTLDQFVD